MILDIHGTKWQIFYVLSKAFIAVDYIELLSRTSVFLSRIHIFGLQSSAWCRCLDRHPYTYIQHAFVCTSLPHTLPSRIEMSISNTYFSRTIKHMKIDNFTKSKLRSVASIYWDSNPIYVKTNESFICGIHFSIRFGVSFVIFGLQGSAWCRCLDRY